MTIVRKLLALLMALALLPFAVCADQPTADELVDELLIYLSENPRASLLFAAELNLSNGPPDERDYGERYMFGKLANAAYVLDNWPLIAVLHERTGAEIARLLLGPWRNGGSTVVTLSTRGDCKVLDLVTGKWRKVKQAQTLRIEHVTEYGGQTRVRHVYWARDGDGWTFGIVKK